MSVTAERTDELRALDVEELETSPVEPGGPDEPEGPEPALDEGEAPVSVPLTSAAIFLSVFAAGWMATGVFRGTFPKVVALVGAALGVGLVALSYRTRRPSIIQYLALPAAVVVGAILVLPDAQGGTANLPSLVSEAIRTGGVAQPPIPFDPGWRFILVVLVAVLGAGAASLATGLNRPRIGIFMPVPLLFGAALLQPEEGSLVGIGVALLLFVGSLAVSYGVELAKEGATSGSFEARRLVRSVGIMVLLVAVLAGLSQFGFLFPETDRDQVIPPKKPEAQPPAADRELFTVRADRRVPWRLGVLDVYDGEAWLLPPYDTKRFLDVPESGVIPREAPDEDADPTPTPPPASAFETRTVEPTTERETMEATFSITDVEGHVIPTLADPQRVRRDGFAVQFDPRTQMFRLTESRASKGMRYTVRAPIPPTGVELSEAGPPPPDLEEFLEMPPPPDLVAALMAEAPTTNLWDRLQFVRNSFYAAVVAAGAGNPVDVPPSRVSDMLNGGEATPYEITAAEAMLARWAGIPSRMGYGFFGGDEKSGAFSIRPKHGATWLEVYYDGLGWVPIVGVPPKAKASLSQAQKNEDPEVRPTEELALIVYVPIRLQSIQLLFVVVRHWIVRVVPLLAGLGVVWMLFPGLVKIARRFRRRRWGDEHGLPERIAVAYAEFRDSAHDLNVGDPTASPLQFLGAVEADGEHTELAWVVTRALWGDLRRDLRPEDADAAEDLARSVTRRLRRAQPGATRLLAFGSRASLREPYTAEVPNLWPAWLRRGMVRRGLRRAAGGLRALNPWRAIRRVLPIGGLLPLVLLLLLTACAQDIPFEGLPGKIELPSDPVPETLDRFSFKREAEVEEAFSKAGKEALVGDGLIYTIREGDDVQGYLEVAGFKPGLGAGKPEVREGVLKGIGGGRFEPQRLGRERIYKTSAGEQTFFLWFPPDGRYFELLVARQGFEDAEQLFAGILAYQRGADVGALDQQVQLGRHDPRRGGED